VKRGELTPKGRVRFDKIVDSAAQVFFEMGYEKCSLNDIVTRSGGSLSTLYKYFGNKEGLLLAIINRKVDIFAEQFQDCDKFVNRDLKTNLTFFAKKFLQVIFTRESVLLYRIIVAECAREDEHISNIFYENGPVKIRSILIKMLEYHAREENLDIKDYDLVAERFLSILKEPYHFRLIINQLDLETLQKDADRIAEEGVELFLSSKLLQK